MPRLVGERLEHELARDRLRGLGAQRLEQLLGGAAAEREVRVE